MQTIFTLGHLNANTDIPMFIDKLKETLGVTDIEDLRDRLILSEEWIKMAEHLQLKTNDLKKFWMKIVYPQMFVQDEAVINITIRKLIIW